MTEFEKVAEFFTRPDKQLWGTAMQYSRVYDFCTCYLYPFMWSQGGEVWDPKTGQVEGILNRDQCQGHGAGQRLAEIPATWCTQLRDRRRD